MVEERAAAQVRSAEVTRLRRVARLSRSAPSSAVGRRLPAHRYASARQAAWRARTPTSTSRPTGSRPASASSTACSAAASCPGSLVLLGGEPGIGKSTLLLQAAAHFARAGRPGALRVGRGVRAPDQVARRAARASATRRCTCWPRPASSGSSRRSAALKPALLVVDSIQTVFSLQVPVGAGQHRPGARGGDAVPVRGQGPGRADLPRRPRHQGRSAGRSEGARARRRHGALLRGRAAPRPPRRAGRQEPLRRGQRARRLRDDRRRACGRCPIRRSCSWPNGPIGDARLGGAVLRRGLAAAAGRGAGARQHQHLRHRAANGRSASTPNRVSLLLAVLEKRAGLDVVGDDVFVNIAGGHEPSTSRRSTWRVVAALASSVRNRPVAARRRRCSARSDWAARCAACHRRRCASARRASSGSPGSCCRPLISTTTAAAAPTRPARR